jgi:oligosaccharide repeat unit polymerase
MTTTKNFLKYSVIGGLFLVPFIAFLVPNAMFFPFISGKGFAFRILVEILFGMTLVLACVDKDYRPRFSWISSAVLFFTTAILVADLMGVSVYKSLWSNYERMEGFVLIIHLAMFYFVTSTVLNTKLRWENFINVSIFSSVIMSLYGLGQLAGIADIHQGTTRLDATLGNASYLAIYLVFHIFLCLYLYFGEKVENWKKWTYGSIVVLETIVLYFTATRGAILGLIGGLFLVGLLMVWKEKQNKALRKWAYGIIGAVAVLIIGFMLVRNVPAVKNNIVLSRFTTLSFAEFKTQGRSYVWPMALKGFSERPVFGWGQENFNFVFNKYYDPGMFGQEEWFDRTHDIFLDWLIAGGIVGFLSYASLYIALFYYIWRKKSNLKLIEKSLLTGLLSAYIFHNIFVFDNLTSYILFFSLLAFVHSMNADSHPSHSKFYTKTFSADVLSYVITPIVLIGTFCVIYYVNIPAILANTTLIKTISGTNATIEGEIAMFKQVYSYHSFGDAEATEQLAPLAQKVSESSLPPETKKLFYDFAEEKILAKVKSSPHDARYLVFAGTFYTHIGKQDEGLKYLEKALIESPKKQSIFIEIGSTYLAKGNTAKMLEYFKKAYDLRPSSRDAQVIYTIGAIYAKNETVLTEMYKIIDKDLVINDNRLIKAYIDVGNYEMVINILLARLEKDPKNEQYELSLAQAYATIGQKQNAILVLQKMISDNPDFKTKGEEYIKQIQNQ